MQPSAEERRKLAGSMLLRGAGAIAAAAVIWYAGTDLVTRIFYSESFQLLLMIGVFAIVIQLGLLPIAAFLARHVGRRATWVIYSLAAAGFLFARVKFQTQEIDWLQEILASLLYFLAFLAGVLVIGPIAGPGWQPPPDEDEEDETEA